MNDRQVQRYETWFRTRAGNMAYWAEIGLLKRLISAWPRRHQKLVEIGCGPGLFLPVYYEAGFDITGVDPSASMLKAARKRMGQSCDFHLARAEHLPFDDNEYDFAVLFTVLEFCEDPVQALAEAIRVTRKGVLVGFLNRHSLYYLSHGRRWPWRSESSTLGQANWFTLDEMKRMTRQTAGDIQITQGSVLPLPMWSWRDTWGLRHINRRIWPARLGSFVALRCDCYPEKPRTSLPAFAQEPKPKATSG